MNIKPATATLLGLSTASAFRPQPIPVPVPVPVPKGPLDFPPTTPRHQPRTIQPIRIEKRAPEPKPTLQELLPAKINGGRHQGLRAYTQAFPDLANEFNLTAENDSTFEDKLSLFWLKQLEPVFQADATVSEQRQRLDEHLVKSVGKNPKKSDSAFLSDTLKGKDLTQNIEYLRLAILALKQSFQSTEDPGLEDFRRQYNPKDGSEITKPTLELTPKVEGYLKSKNIDPVKVAVAIENVLSTRYSRLKSRSQLMENNAQNLGFLRP